MKKAVLTLAALILLIAGCGANSGQQGYLIFSLQQDARKLLESTCYLSSDDISDEEWVAEMTRKLNEGENVPAGAIPLLPDGVKIQNAKTESGNITVDLEKGYYDQSVALQLMIRAGLAKTLTQIDSIHAMFLTIDGKPAVDTSGNELPSMRSNTFVDENSDGINNYRSTQMTLYFANEAGDGLVAETKTAYYSVNTPIEQAVLNELITGPTTPGAFRTLAPDVNVLNVTIQDDICYVNFDESFQNSVFELDPKLQIDSMVESLASVCSVEQVAFSVNGSSSLMYKDQISLDQIFTPSLTSAGS